MMPIGTFLAFGAIKETSIAKQLNRRLTSLPAVTSRWARFAVIVVDIDFVYTNFAILLVNEVPSNSR
jgi:hypothetical protein